jgi:SAM-dependent methyltransferase
LKVRGQAEAVDVDAGVLICSGCEQEFPLIDGVPTFTQGDEARDVAQTTSGFARNWETFNREIMDNNPLNTELFKDWVWPLNPEWLRGRKVLEAGCGMGRWLRVAAQQNPAVLIGFDYSDIAYTAARNTKELANVHVVRADIFRLPFKPVFDVQHSIGVIHHTPDPARAFDSLVKMINNDGVISCWVYGAENNEWITRFVDPVRTHVTSRMPHRMLSLVSAVLALELRVAANVYAAAGSPRFAYGDYLGHLRRYPFKYMEHIIYDHLVPKIAYYLPKEELMDWAGRHDLAYVLSARNQNSWRLLASARDDVLQAATAPLSSSDIRQNATRFRFRG